MKYCTNCGNKLSENSVVCTNCGKLLDSKNNKDKNNFNKKNKFWFFPLIVIFSILFLFATFEEDDTDNDIENNNSNDVGVSDESNNIDSNIQDDKKDNTSDDNNNTIGNYIVNINDYEITYNYNGDPIILISFSFTNNDDEEAAFGYALDTKVYQNDIEITQPFSTYGIDNLNWEDEIKYVKPGKTFTFNIGYELSDTTSDVTVEVTSFWSSKYSKKVSKTFVIE